MAFKSFSPFKKSHIFDLIHINVYMMQYKSIGGAFYFVTLINDFSREEWLCFEI